MESSFDADFLSHIINWVVEKLKLKLKSRLRKRVVLEETVEEKEPTSSGNQTITCNQEASEKEEKEK